MVDSHSDFAFRKLSFYIYLPLEVMLHVDHPEVLSYFFSVNKATRSYIETNFLTIRNAFINAGLVTYQLLSSNFNHYYLL